MQIVCRTFIVFLSSFISFNIISLMRLEIYAGILVHKFELIFFFNSSIAIVSTQLNGFNYCYLTLIILFDINHLIADSEVVTSIAI